MDDGLGFEPAGPDGFSVGILGIVWFDKFTGRGSYQGPIGEGSGVPMRSLMSILLFLNTVFGTQSDMRVVFDHNPAFGGRWVNI